MTEPKFTPAPWEYVKTNGLIVSDHLLFSGIARVACWDEEGIANANLIAAAPDLYDFIARLVNSGLSLDILKIVEEGELLLAKARGE